MNRRHLLHTGAAAALLVAARPALAQAPGGPPLTGEDARLRTLLDAFFEEQVDESPGAATSLGLDKGTRAPLKHRLDDRSLTEKARRLARSKDRLARLQAIDRTRLNAASQVDVDVVEYTLKQGIEGSTRFAYGSAGGRYSPYVISQLNGAYQDIPDFMDSAHQVKDAEGADAYLDRLRAFLSRFL